MIKRLLIALVALLVLIPTIAWVHLNSRARAALDTVVATARSLEAAPRTRASHVVPPADQDVEGCLTTVFAAHQDLKTPDACSTWLRTGATDALPAECATWSESLGDWPTQVLQCARGKESPKVSFWAAHPAVLPMTAVNAFAVRAQLHTVTLEQCADAVAFARDRHRGAGTLGLGVATAMLKRLVPPCVKVLDAAPTAEKWKFAQAMDTVLETLPALSADLRGESVWHGLTFGAFMDPKLHEKISEQWKSALTTPYGDGSPLQPVMVRNAVIEGQDAFAKAIPAADLAPADRDAQLSAAFAPLQKHWNPLLQYVDFTGAPKMHDDEHALVVLLSRAAMLDAMGPQDKAPDLSRVRSTLKIEQRDGTWVLSAAGLEATLHADAPAPAPTP